MDKTIVQPINNFVLVEKKFWEHKTKSGLELAEKSYDKALFTKGEVLAVGNKIDDIKVEDTVIYRTKGAIELADKQVLVPYDQIRLSIKR